MEALRSGVRVLAYLVLALPLACAPIPPFSGDDWNGDGIPGDGPPTDSTDDGSLVAQPGTIDFGYTAPGGFSSSETITITNYSAASVTIEAIEIGEGDDQPFWLYQVPSELPRTLNPGATEVISAYFAPYSNGSYLGAIEILTDGSNETLLVRLGGCSSNEDCGVDFGDSDSPIGDDDDDDDGGGGGTAPEPSGGAIALDPSSVDFGDVGENQTAIGEVISIQNVGSGDLVITEVTITGIDAAMFSVAGFSGGTIQPGAAPMNLSLSFDPRAGDRGHKSATLVVQSNDGFEPTSEVELSAVVTEDCVNCLPEWTIVGAGNFDLGNGLGGFPGGLPGATGASPYLQVGIGTVDVLIQNSGTGQGTITAITEGGTLLGMFPFADNPEVTFVGGVPLTLAVGETGTIQFSIADEPVCELVNLDSSTFFVMGTATEAEAVATCLNMGGLGGGGLPF